MKSLPRSHRHASGASVALVLVGSESDRFRAACQREPVQSTLRFVALFHQLPAGAARSDHWDLMFEWGQALRTWAIDFAPRPGASGAADALRDHRLEYLNYEGPISRNRGDVRRWDWGDFELLEDTPQLCRVRLHGQQLQNIEVNFIAQADQRWSVSFSAAGSSEPDRKSSD